MKIYKNNRHVERSFQVTQIQIRSIIQYYTEYYYYTVLYRVLLLYRIIQSIVGHNFVLPGINVSLVTGRVLAILGLEAGVPPVELLQRRRPHLLLLLLHVRHYLLFNLGKLVCFRLK